MRTSSLLFFTVCCGLAAAQPASDTFDKAPPAIEEALRARVQAFYQAHVDGKFRKADDYVAEDSKDAFFAAEKNRYQSCDVSSIRFEEDFTKATVVTACKTEMFFHGEKFPVTVPFSSRWKVENGNWFWYYVASNQKESPFGTWTAGPESEHGRAPIVPPDMNKLAQQILSKVTIDRNEVTVEQDHDSRQEIHLKNDMMGAIQVSTDPTGLPGLTVRAEKAQVNPGEEVTIIVEFNFDDPEINCRPCLVNPGVKPPMTVNIHTSPIQRDFPIKINFAHHAQ
jgi:hypothetical protein